MHFYFAWDNATESFLIKKKIQNSTLNWASHESVFFWWLRYQHNKNHLLGAKFNAKTLVHFISLNPLNIFQV